MKTQIVYRTKPSSKDIAELKELMPNLEIEFLMTMQPLTTTIDPFYKLKIVDWTWFRTLFDDDIAVSCLCLDDNELENAGITGHWGFYSLADGDLNHQFYMTNRKRFDSRAKANGFSSNFAWMFIHEYLHGARWEETKDRQKAAQDVHDWEAQGLLKQKLAENLEKTNQMRQKVSLLTQLLELTKRFNILKKKTNLVHPVPAQYRRVTQGYGVPNPIYTATKHHIGIDYGTPVGTPVYAPVDGEIVHSGETPILGKYVHYKFILGSQTYVIRCAHLSETKNVGKYKAGDDIGYTGNTGMSSGPHLHLDLWPNGVAINLLTEQNFRDYTLDFDKWFSTAR